MLNMADSLVRAAERMGLRRVRVLTPYRDDLNRLLQARLSSSGFEVTAFHGTPYTSPAPYCRTLPFCLSRRCPWAVGGCVCGRTRAASRPGPVH